MLDRPETIENRWDILYKDYPETYDAFAQIEKRPTGIEMIDRYFPLSGRLILDVGSGTGRSTFPLAMRATLVTGIEPEEAMWRGAERSRQIGGLENVHFVAAMAEELPIAGHRVDMVIAMTLASLHREDYIIGFANEAERVVRPGGLIVSVDLAPGWYGGELAPVILGKPRTEMPRENLRDRVFERLGFRYIDYLSVQDYRTVDCAIATYGFIFGRAAIDHIRETGRTTIRWKIRLHFKRVLG